MIAKYRRGMLLGVLAAGLLVMVGCCHWQLGAARAAAAAAADDTADCERRVLRIRQLRGKPTLAGLQEVEMTELARKIEQTALAKQIPAQSLLRVSPEAARRLGDSPYKEKPTQLVLRMVTLRQLIGFLHAVSSEGCGLQVKSIRLTAPREQEIGDRWTAEVTLTYLVYAPPAESQGGKEGL
jgi:hypothetical protein